MPGATVLNASRIADYKAPHCTRCILKLKRLLVTYIFVILSALAVIGALVFATIGSTLNDQFIYSNQLVLENGVDLIEVFIKRNKDVVLSIAVDSSVQAQLDEFVAGGRPSGNIVEYIQSVWPLSESIKSVAGFVEVYPYPGNTPYAFNPDSGGYETTHEEPWMREVIASDGAFVVRTCELNDTPYVRVAMLARSIEHWPEDLGIIALYIKTEVMLSLSYKIRLENSNVPYIVDENGEIILPYENIYRVSRVDLESRRDGWWRRGDQIIINTPMTQLGWKLMGILPVNELMEHSRNIRSTFLIVGSTTVLILITVSVLFSVWITRPINNLARAMSRVEHNQFAEIGVDPSYGTATRQLYSQFNYMIRRTKSLIDEVYLAQIREKEAELLALQQQINPHFLYNTLDSIAWMSMAYKAEDIRYMVMSLASMMRYSLNEGNNYISVQDELAQIRNYVGIQEIRYDHRFKTTISCEAPALNYRIIKLIIQPLVENAIVHGFKRTGNFGEIDIAVRIVEEDLVITVTNDGDDVDLDKIRGLLDPDTEVRRKHYGLRNVNDRLVRSFGRRSAIRFGVENGRTVAKIVIALSLLGEGDDDEQDTGPDRG